MPRQSNLTIDITITDKQSNNITENVSEVVNESNFDVEEEAVTQKKDKAKVSFQLENRYEYEYPASDTEIDYTTSSISKSQAMDESRNCEDDDFIEDSHVDNMQDDSAQIHVKIDKKKGTIGQAARKNKSTSCDATGDKSDFSNHFFRNRNSPTYRHPWNILQHLH